MTVASLWKALDAAGSGRAVGANELLSKPEADPLSRRTINPWNFNQQARFEMRKKKASLAVDLSIWICESLTSHAMTENHQNPALHLVFTRTVKLLSLGIKLIFVIEGKRRIRGNAGEDHKFHKRRSGTLFWKACDDCKHMLELLGVHVVRAKAEGEALCALLNQRGIVDGVISNDGDCLLFGANTIYTKFSIENIDNAQVMRYDLSDLKALVDTSDAKDGVKSGTLTLSREDLISFALLTGSDLAGSGLEKVGHVKAIRFIKKCQDDFPVSKRTAAIDELRSWARAASASHIHVDTFADGEGHFENKKHNCSRCCHPGSKRHHEKHGCETCGTGPGEICIEVTGEDKFRKSLRAKALAVEPKFEPAQVVDAYMRPNDNQIPIEFANTTSENLRMAPPRLRELLRMNTIIKGRTLEASREYVKQTVARLMARQELFSDDVPGEKLQKGDRHKLSRERPIPQQITKKLCQNGVACYEVQWIVAATVTNTDGEGLDGYEYSSIEPCDLIDKRHPNLILQFQDSERERKKQGDAEQVRRREFLEQLLNGKPCRKEEDCAVTPIKLPKEQLKKRTGFFESNDNRCRGQSYPKQDKRRAKIEHEYGSDDVAILMRSGVAVLSSQNLIVGAMGQQNDHLVESRKRKRVSSETQPFDASPSFDLISTPERDDSVFCHMGGIMIEITPILSDRASYPPRHIYVRKSLTRPKQNSI